MNSTDKKCDHLQSYKLEYFQFLFWIYLSCRLAFILNFKEISKILISSTKDRMLKRVLDTTSWRDTMQIDLTAGRPTAILTTSVFLEIAFNQTGIFILYLL